MKPVPETLQESKVRLLNAGVHLISQNGFTATSIEEICIEAQVHKGSFYYYFPDKLTFAQSVISYFWINYGNCVQEEALKRIDDPLVRLKTRFELTASFFSEDSRASSGCLIGSFIHELALTHPEVRESCNQTLLALARPIESDLIEAKNRYGQKATVEPAELSRLFLAVWQGSVLLNKSMRGSRLIALNIGHFGEYVVSLFRTDPIRAAAIAVSCNS